jgi:hypothetical protein
MKIDKKMKLYSISINFDDIEIGLHAIKPLLLKSVPNLDFFFHPLHLLQLLHCQIDSHFQILYFFHVYGCFTPFVMDNRDVQNRLVLERDVEVLLRDRTVQQFFHVRQEIVRGRQFQIS